MEKDTRPLYCAYCADALIVEPAVAPIQASPEIRERLKRAHFMNNGVRWWFSWLCKECWLAVRELEETVLEPWPSQSPTLPKT